MSNVNIKGLDKAKVLQALFNNSKYQGFNSWMEEDQEYKKSQNMTEEKARSIIENGSTQFDYLQGRVMKIDISGDTLDPWGYDRDNGQGAAARALQNIK